MTHAFAAAGRSTKNVTVNLKEAMEKKYHTEYPPIGLQDTIGFGKHRGEILWSVIEQDPDYLKFLIRENVCVLTNEAYEELKNVIDLD